MNKGTVKNSYPLPLISELIDSMGTKKVFMKMNLRWGYNNVRIKEDDEQKAAFTTHIGSFEPTVIYFGLTNSPAIFQAMMNDLFRDMINKGDVITFIDDVLVATETEEEYDKIVKEVLKRLEENDLYVKPEKCMQKTREIRFLEMIMGLEGFKIEKKKVKGVMKQPTSQGVKDIQKFLGLANYYRRFVKDFAKITKPLHQLVWKDKKWKWGMEQEEAFRKLKEVFTIEPVLTAPNLDKEMRVEVNASDYTMGGDAIYEVQGWKVAFISKLLNKTERNYEIHNKEMLAIIHCLEAQRHFLEGARIKFEIWMDHKNLEYFMTNQKLN